MIVELATTLEIMNMHELIAHGDTSPPNVLLLVNPMNHTLPVLTEENTRMVQVIDFGGSRKLGEELVMYTIGYCAPEVHARDAKLTVEKEVYSFSMIALVLLLGRDFKKKEVDTGIESVTYPTSDLAMFLLRGVSEVAAERPSWKEILQVLKVAIGAYEVGEKEGRKAV
jgi:serine/threonine protein kinase